MPTALAFYLPEPTPTSQFLPPVQLIPSPRTPLSLFLSLPPSSSPLQNLSPSPHTTSLALKMATRPQNIGVKAIEVYFPSQVRAPRLAPASRPPPRCRILGLGPVLPPSTTANCLPCLEPGLVLTISRAKTVCRAVRARDVRRRQCRKVHNWSGPDQDGFL